MRKKKKVYNYVSPFFAKKEKHGEQKPPMHPTMAVCIRL